MWSDASRRIPLLADPESRGDRSWLVCQRSAKLMQTLLTGRNADNLSIAGTLLIPESHVAEAWSRPG